MAGGLNDLEGSEIQGYLLESLVGKGGMAWVYKALHKKLNEYMAVKIMLPHLIDEGDLRERFLDEAKIQFKLKHPNIVQVTDIIEQGHIIGIVMEWIGGENLKQSMDRMEQPVSRKDIWRVMSPVLDALGFAHSRNLVHRDIKPANILLHREEGYLVPKIADFGIAKILGDEGGKTQTGTAMGTLKFMAPEQIRDSKNVDQRVDVYALGMTLFIMATLRFPFEGSQEWIIYQQINDDPPPPSTYNSRLSSAFDRVVLKALAKDPEERFQNCAELGHALSLALLDPESITKEDRDLNTADIYNMLLALPEEHSIYETTLEPLSATLAQRLFSGDSNTMMNIQKYVMEESDATTYDGGSSPAASMSLEDTSAETMVASEGLLDKVLPKKPKKAKKSKKTSKEASSSSPMVAIVAIVVLLVLGGGGFFMMGGLSGKNAVTPPIPRPNQNQSRPSTTPRTPRPAATCQNGATQPCYSGASGTKNRGICKAGTRTCNHGKFGACLGQVLPKEETCNGLDDDCNGKVDETFAKQGKSCTSKIGECSVAGMYKCSTKQKKAVCVRDSKASAQGDNIKLRIRPSSRTFRISYARKKRRVKGSYCFGLSFKRTRVRLSSRGYYVCTFKLPRRSKTLRIRMKRINPNDFAPSVTYCIR